MNTAQQNDWDLPSVLLTKNDIIDAMTKYISKSIYYPECYGVEAKSMENIVEVYLYYSKNDYKNISMAEIINKSETFLRDCLPILYKPSVFVIETPDLDPHEQYMFIKKQKEEQEFDRQVKDIIKEYEALPWWKKKLKSISKLI